MSGQQRQLMLQAMQSGSTLIPLRWSPTAFCWLTLVPQPNCGGVGLVCLALLVLLALLGIGLRCRVLRESPRQLQNPLHRLR